MSKVKLLGYGFSTVGELQKALSKLPANTPLDPFGSTESMLYYVSGDKRAYLDEAYDWLSDDEMDSLEEQLDDYI